MKKVINQPADFVDETMEGIVAAYGDRVHFLDGDRRVLVSGYPSQKGKVGIVTAGGSGHLPLFLGYVGAGMVDACAVGNVFASPAYTKMASAIRAVEPNPERIWAPRGGEPVIVRLMEGVDAT